MAEIRSGELTSRENIKLMMEGKLNPDIVNSLRRMAIKEEDRFWKYVDILQEKTGFKERILLRLSDHLYIVAKGDERIVKCDCGYEFGDYRINWKLGSLVRARKTTEEMKEAYTFLPKEMPHPEEGLVEIREFYCPGCLAQLAVELVPPGYPVVFEMFPDLDTFYRDWMGQPLPDENPEWFQDKTLEEISHWDIE
ncbi:MAG TPA: acetone carboxylase subunit gamma [Dehalococcoidia bacterium]|nr:acetone carboxylase subunit gamma [Dehalococcoidia bacterium]